MALPPGTTFIVPLSGKHKYVALIPTADGTRKVPFGDRRYEHYRDSVPVDRGGSQWAHLDHGDPVRRHNYRTRARGQKCDGIPCVSIPLTPAWFSYNYLW